MSRFDNWQYLLLMAGCLAITLPLEILFGSRVYRQPLRLVRAMAVPVGIFVAWDLWAVDRDHWTYNPDYVTGFQLPGDLPIEELVFFLVIPICSLLTYETVGRVLRGEVGWLRRLTSRRR